jgi:hypothetical protein
LLAFFLLSFNSFLSFCFRIFFLFIYSYLYSFCRSLTHPVCFYSIIYVFLRSCIHWYFPLFFLPTLFLFIYSCLYSFGPSLTHSLILYAFPWLFTFFVIHAFIPVFIPLFVIGTSAFYAILCDYFFFIYWFLHSLNHVYIDVFINMF